MSDEKDKSFKVGVNVTSTLLEKVLGSLDRATGGLTKAWRVRREGYALVDVRARELRLLAQAETDAAAIREGRARFGDDGKLVLLPPSPSAPPLSLAGAPDERADVMRFLTEGAARIANDEALRQTTNLLRTAAKAEDFARESNAKPSAEEVDPDWLARWRRGAQDVSDEKLQQMWARLLVNEVEEPGDANLRVVNLLSLLAASDAQRIAKLGPYVFDESYVIEVLEPMVVPGINVFPDAKEVFPLDERLYLEEIGVLRGVEGRVNRGLKFPHFLEGKYFSILKIRERVLVALTDKKNFEVENDGLNLTGVGQRLLSLGSFTPNEGYLRSVGLGLKKLGLKVLLGDAASSPDNPDRHRLINEVEL